MFNLSPKWNFPSNNHSQIIGIADSGVEMFKGRLSNLLLVKFAKIRWMLGSTMLIQLDSNSKHSQSIRRLFRILLIWKMPLNDLVTSGKFRIPRKREIFSNVP